MEKIAEGFTAEVFALDADCVLKLYKPRFAAVRDTECRKLRLLSEVFDFVPRAFDLVERDGRLGYTMSRVAGATLGSGDVVRAPDEVASRLHDLARRFRNAAVASQFEPIRPLIARRIAARAPRLGPIADRALRLLADLPVGYDLCHGDFHPGNVLVSPSGDFVIDWNGAGPEDGNADVAKSLLLMRFGPPGLALAGGLHRDRRRVCAAYLALCRESGLAADERLGPWLFVRASELVALDVPGLVEELAPALDGWLSSDRYDPERFIN